MRAALLLAAWFVAAPAVACSCLTIEPMTAEELKADGLVLFIGKAVKVEAIPSGTAEGDQFFLAGSHSMFAVERHWANDLGSKVHVESGFPAGGGGYVFKEGEEYVVFASPADQRPGALLSTSSCTRTAPLKEATELVNEIERLIGKSKLPEPPLENQLTKALQCDAHIVETWRHLEANAFRGRVRIRPEGDAFPEALVAIRKRGGDEIRETRTDDQGRFHIDGLEAGVYEFVVCAPGMDPDRGWIDIQPHSGVREVTLFLRLGV